MENKKCPFCNKRDVDDGYGIEQPVYKLRSQDFWPVRIDTYRVLKINCCSTCYRREKRLKSCSKYLKWISVGLFVILFLTVANGIVTGTILVFGFLGAIIPFVASYILYRFWKYFLKYMR